jgi:hypothetical protein
MPVGQVNPMQLLLKRILVVVCVIVGFFGIIYNVAVLPFSSPIFDLVSWVCIGISALVLAYIGRRK